MMKQIHNYIDGQLAPAAAGNTIDCYNPATGEVYAQLPASQKEDVQMAVDAAASAFADWSSSSIEYRSALLNKIADLIEANLETLALAESVDNGKTLQQARSIDIPRAASNFRFFASAIVNASTESHIMEGVAVNYTRRAAIGTVACISPWNLPLYLFTWKIAPALATGNCVIAKPSEITPMTAYLLSKLCIEAGLPSGVLNILHGYGHEVGHNIISHPKVKAISFTGGTATGQKIAATAAPMFKKLSLELGGKNPTIIFADCDYEKALANAVRSSFTNQGEICLCGSRLLVERSIYEQFEKDFVARVGKLKVGDPLESNDVGAIVSKQHLEKIASYVDLAIAEGGTVMCGGKIPKLDGRIATGYYFEPTVISGLSNHCKVNQEEIFGPVVTLQPFDTMEEAIALANDSTYGLAANVWTKDLTKAHQVSHRLETGIVWVNCWLLRDLRTPFGGMKSSGVGREGGNEALRFFTEPQNICIALK